VQGGVEDFQREIGDRVIFADGELAEAGAGSETLRQFQFEVLKSQATDGAAEAHDGRLADPHHMGQVGHGAVHHGSWIEEHMVGHLQLRLA
jgi:hypothetical protein